jgi:hypothetical protein
MACPRVLLLKPCLINYSERPLADSVVFDGPGDSVPSYCWERQGTLLRTLDVVQYKVSALDRKRPLLPVERELWSVVQPFLSSIRKFADEINQQAVSLDDLETEEQVVEAVSGSDLPWSLSVGASASSVPAVGDRAHVLLYAPKAGVFTRRFADPAAMPLVTLPCRLQNSLPLFPPPARILDYLESIAPRIASARTVQFLRQARRRLPLAEEAPGATADVAVAAKADAKGDAEVAGAVSAAAEKETEAGPTADAGPPALASPLADSTLRAESDRPTAATAAGGRRDAD